MRQFLCILCLVFGGTPAFAQALSVFGQSDGSLCYEQSRDGMSPQEAVATCSRALAGMMSNDERAYTYVNRSINYNLLGRYDDALDDINAAFDLIPDLPEAYLSRGNTNYLQRNYLDAIEDYSTALDRGVGDAHKAYFNRALAHEELKDYELAYQDFKSSVDEDPTFGPAVERLELYNNTFKGETWLS